MRKEKREKPTIQRQIRYYILVVLLISCVSIGGCIVVTTALKEKNDEQLDNISMLSDFYQAANDMDGYARAYLSGKKSEDYDFYLKKQQEARKNLEIISLRLDANSVYRISWLKNMLDTYDERLQLYLGMPQNWYTGYQLLDYTNDLIQGTSSRYHDMLIDYVQSQMIHAQQLWRIQVTLILIALTFLLMLSVWFSHYFSHKICNPIKEIIGNIQSVRQGDYNISPVFSSLDELKILADSFADMVTILENNYKLLKFNIELDHQLLEKENENLTIKNLLYQSELKNLQAQINPHFLFNTLNMIARRAVLNGDSETNSLIENTSVLLRYGLDKTSKISTFQEEISCIESYIFIQQRRFEGRVNFKLDVDPDIPNLSMPAMVLQPIVENSVIHGIRDMIESAEVALKAYCFEGKLHIYIEDNGQGISSEVLEILEASFEPLPNVSLSVEERHIGLTNVYRRLKMYYGDGIEFYVESEVGCGTVVTLKIPLEPEEAL